jgi:hypothetical protein
MSPTKRGIVICPPFRQAGQNLMLNTPIDLQEIRKYLFLWDEIDYPDNNFIHFELPPDLEYLQTCGVLKRTKLNYKGGVYISGEDASFFTNVQQEAFKQNNQKEYGQWSLAQLSTTQYYDSTSPQLGIEFELFNYLPVPNTDVPFADILEFKEKRRSELLAVRIFLDELYEGIISAKDIPRAKNNAFNKIELALAELNIVMDEGLIKKKQSSLRGTIPAVDSGLRASGVANILNSSYSSEAFMGGVAFFAIKNILFPQKTGVSNPMTYIESIGRDCI